ncbi:probable apyrase 7 [Impatiens glandulifera]|uniref:probable apyrase 7 n=1 Tax=Impatiens glandulifera TaxID=253017 RepID=UPI001FB07268|nr:probable apyrase 7 [Impatiens glandulifera]
MVLNRISELFSAAKSHLSSTKPSNRPSISPEISSAHSYSFTGYEPKTYMRISSSLQDFSTYNRLDPEEANHVLDVSLNHAKQSHPPLPRGNLGSSFSKHKSLQTTPLARRKWVRVITVALCLLLAALFVFGFKLYYTNWSQATSKFFVVLDCGSTGTRVYVYQASMNQKSEGELPITLTSLPKALRRKPNSQSGRAYNRMETEPGFDRLVHNVSGLTGAIKPLIKWAEKQIPKNAHKTTSLFLYATAGVRRLSSPDSEWLLNTAWTILKGSSFMCQREWIKTISGMEEAYFGWIALNYHTENLGAVPRKATFGALDLGGSSLQVTFESKDYVNNETSLRLSIGPVSHHLSAYSLSGYGLNDAFDKSVAHLLKKQTEIHKVDPLKGNIKIEHPCLLSGYQEKYLCSLCASIYHEGGSPMNGGKYMVQARKQRIPIQLIGAPKWGECKALAKIAVNLSEWSDLNPGIDCEQQPCALVNNLPRPHGQFHGMSGFFVVYRFFNLSLEATLDDVLEKGQEFCEKTWSIAKKSVAPQPFIEQYCFRSPYIVSLLRDGLHISDTQVSIGSGSTTWTLGVALLEAGKVFSTRMDFRGYKILDMKINPVILFALMFISMIFLLCALSCVGNWTPRFVQRPYIPLFRQSSAPSTSLLHMPSPSWLQRWSANSGGDGKVKTPLSPTTGGSNPKPFGAAHGFGGSAIELAESSSLHPSSTSGVSHSYSSGSLGQMQFNNTGMGSPWTSHRNIMNLQSRRSQSREDLNSSLAELHLAKV